MIETYLREWKLTPDGPLHRTPTSQLCPVTFEGRHAMLKLAMVDEERRGGQQLVWWAGDGAAPILAHTIDALLMERADDPLLLTRMAVSSNALDLEACRILCRVAERLHAPRDAPPPRLEPLEAWFRALRPAAQRYGGLFREAHAAAQTLLAEPRDVRPLHGDLHHGNVLHFGTSGWLAIDPKGLVGERTFDFANVFCNPTSHVASDARQFAERVRVISEEAHLKSQRLLQWILAWCGLSAAWHLEDGNEQGARLTLLVGELAQAALP